MLSLAQTILLIVIVTLTILLTFASIQIFHILNEFRTTLKKLNKKLDSTGDMSGAAFLSHLKNLIALTREETSAPTPQISRQHPKSASKSPRFFRRTS